MGNDWYSKTLSWALLISFAFSIILFLISMGASAGIINSIKIQAFSLLGLLLFGSILLMLILYIIFVDWGTAELKDVFIFGVVVIAIICYPLFDRIMEGLKIVFN